ncbi:MAG: DUF309 domain-containing protein [Myxococcales bacterium]|nr:DUF309 domain-containing protein [Myxococcales bacterium]
MLPPLDDPRTLAPGVEMFNREDFFACHDFFEELWFSAQDPEKTFLQGLILTAVGFHHLTRGNYEGARRQWAKALGRLDRPEYLPRYLHIETAEFLEQIRACERRLLELGPDRIREFDGRMIPLLPLGGRPSPSQNPG